MLDFTSLPCILSPMHVFFRKAGDFCGVYSQVHLDCVSQPSNAGRFLNKEQAGCNSPEKRTTEHKHAGICLFPSLQELLCRDWKTNDSLMV